MFLLRNSPDFIHQFESELINLAKSRGTIDVDAGAKYMLLNNKIGCQFNGLNNSIATIYYRTGSNEPIFIPVQRLAEAVYNILVGGTGSKGDEYFLLCEGKDAAELAKDILEDFVDFAVSEGLD